MKEKSPEVRQPPDGVRHYGFFVEYRGGKGFQLGASNMVFGCVLTSIILLAILYVAVPEFRELVGQVFSKK